MSDVTKCCSRCGVDKPLNEYHKDRAKPDGHAPRCKACKSADAAAYREANREKLLADAAAYREAKREKLRAAGRRYAAAHRKQARRRSSAWYKANRQRALANAKAWADANPAKVQSKAKRHYDRNSERYRQAAKTYRANNPDKWRDTWTRSKEKNREQQRTRDRERSKSDAGRAQNRVKSAKRRATKLNNGVYELSRRDMQRLMNAESCYLCGCNLTGERHIDHIIPLSRGGRHSIGNLAAACPTCNMRKHTLTPVEFRARKV